MNVWLASAGASADSPPVEAFRLLASRASPSSHTLAGSPADADLILFCDCHLYPHDPALRVLRRNPLLRTYSAKCLVYDERDLPWPVWPGVYVSMSLRDIVPAYQVPWAYYTTPVATPAEQLDDPDLLFSFIGSLTHPVRRDLLRLAHERGVVEQAIGFTFYDSSSPDFSARRELYATTLARSKFVLCPRGKGTSSIRLYEVLAAGRVPVIISDQWAAPSGPDWNRCSIRWPESAVASLPSALEEREGDFGALAAGARDAYGEWFAPDRSYDRIIDACQGLLERGTTRTFPRRGIRRGAYLRAEADHVQWCTRAHLAAAVRGARRTLLSRRRDSQR